LSAVETTVGRATPSELSRLDFIREIDQSLAEKHHAGLKYPPHLLARAAAFALMGKTHSDASRLAWSSEPAPIGEQSAAQIAEIFLQGLGVTAALREGVRAGIDELASGGCRLIVVTEGSRERTKATIEKHSLRALDQVLQIHKDLQAFQRLAQLTTAPSRPFMVGDQLQRDMVPAKNVGFWTIYFPGGFRPRWEPEVEVVKPDFQVERFDQIPPIVAAH
jgi:putative hydrolase of the HAD superfamily